MTLNSVIVSVLALAVLSVPSQAQVRPEQLSSIFSIGNLQHPYLFFSATDRKVLQNRVASDRDAKRVMETLIAEGHRFLHVPLKDPPPVSPKHSRYVTGPNEFEHYIDELSDGAVVLAFLYQMTGDAAYARKAIEFAMALSDLDSWVNPAHKFDIIYPRVWPWNVPDDRVVFTYDITASGVAIALATVYDWVYPELSMAERDKIRSGLMEKCITRVRGNYDYFWWASAYRCNWSAICYTGLGLSALSLLKEHPELVDVAAEAYNRITRTFDHIGQDGGWQEGRGYYGYMMRESVFFMDAMKRLSNGTYNLFRHPKVHDRPMDFLLYSLTANLEDGEGFPVGPTYMVDKLVQETSNGTGAWYRNTFLGNDDGVFDLIWPHPIVTAVEPANGSKLFRTINWAILRSSFTDPSAVTIACKAGYNDDPHHGHLDCGQFILTWHNIPFIRDIGRMRYDELYFNQDRWDYPYASSRGHNLIFVNGEEQIPAKLKNKPWKEGIGGPVVDFRSGPSEDYVLMDPTHAYPGKELKKWRRHIVLDKPDITLILDEVGSKPGSTIEARFFPGASNLSSRPGRESRFPARPDVEYTLAGPYVLLSAQGHRLALIPVCLGNTVKVVDNSLPALPVTEDSRLVQVPYVESVITAQKDYTVLATLIVPVADSDEAARVSSTANIQSGGGENIEVSINATGGEHRWTFEKTRDGYTLQQ
jgi:Heparinase II/III-like protein